MMNKTAFEERGGGGGAKEAGSGMNDFSPHCMGRGGKGDLETTTAEDQINQILVSWAFPANYSHLLYESEPPFSYP